MRCIIKSKKNMAFLESQKHGLFSLKVMSYVDGKGKTNNYVSVLLDGVEIAQWACPVTMSKEGMIQFVEGIRDAKNIADAKKACRKELSMSRADFQFANLAERLANDVAGNAEADYVTYNIWAGKPTDVIRFGNLNQISITPSKFEKYFNGLSSILPIEDNKDAWRIDEGEYVMRTAFKNAVKQASAGHYKNGNGLKTREVLDYILDRADVAFDLLRKGNLAGGVQVLKLLDLYIKQMSAIK